MRYFDMSEKKLLAENIKSRLKSSGTWITCDVTLASMIENESKNPDFYDKGLANAVYHRKDNSFASVASCIGFFNDVGLDAKHHTPRDHIVELSSRVFETSQSDILNAGEYVNVLRLKKHR